MPVGRRLAYDAARGRLWVVCPACGEWNLAPLHERWEAIEECERLFHAADARVSSDTVSVADCGGVALVRVGADALRDEIANTRYGPRLRRRRARRRMLSVVAGAIAGGAVGVMVLLGASSGSAYVALYAGAAGIFHCYYLWRRAGQLRLARFRRSDGRHAWLTLGEMETAEVPERRGGRTRRGRRSRELGTDLTLWMPRGLERMYGDDVLAPLAAILPALNAAGASEMQLRAAVALVDQAENLERRREARSAGRGEREPRSAWQRLLQGGPHTAGYLVDRTASERLALEMAVSEELERRSMQRDAATQEPGAVLAGEVAEIADNMFVPQSVLDWIARYRASRAQLPATDVPSAEALPPAAARAGE